MTFSIEPDRAFQRVGTAAARKEPSRTPSEAGEEFARFLAQDTRAQETDAQPPAVADRKAPDTEGPTAPPLLNTDTPPDELLADTAQESDTALLAAPEPEVEGQEELTAKTEGEKEDAIEADDASDADEAQATSQGQTEPAPSATQQADDASDADEAQVLWAQATSQGQTEPAPSATQQADAVSDTRAAPAEAATQESTAPPEAQSMLVTAANPEATKPSTSRTSAEMQRTVTATAPTPVSTSGPATASAPNGSLTPGKPATKAQPSPETETAETFATAELPANKDASDTKLAAVTSPTPDGTLLASAPAAAPAPASQPVQAQQPQQPQMTPTNALVTASPADTVKIISDTIAAPDDAPDRITVQLDPPELGRVSIDFKFDSHGLQHVTVTGENPEALRQLRLMHFELTQALERSGLSSQNMTFQQQQSGQQQAQSSPARGLFATQDSDTSNSTLITPAVQPVRPPRTTGGGLNIRL